MRHLVPNKDLLFVEIFLGFQNLREQKPYTVLMLDTIRFFQKLILMNVLHHLKRIQFSLYEGISACKYYIHNIFLQKLVSHKIFILNEYS